MFGVFDAGSAPQVLATIPEIVWEASLGLYLTFKASRPRVPFSTRAPTPESTPRSPSPLPDGSTLRARDPRRSIERHSADDHGA
jgi:hypothetical protein